MAAKKAAAPEKKPAPAAAKKAGTAVAKVDKQPTAVQPTEMTDLFAAHAGEGLERASMKDYALPFLYLLQKGSPQVDENDDAYVEGAKPGMFINTVTSELFDALTVIPCDFQKVHNEWVPRDAGGGFVGSYNTAEEAESKKRDDTQIVETANHFVLCQNSEGQWQTAILSLTSTKLKASRNWNSQIAQRMITTQQGKRTAPSFACIYRVESQSDKNEHGTFFTIGSISPIQGEDGWVSDPDVFQMAIAFRESIKSGIAKASFEKDPSAKEVEVDEDDNRY